MSQIKKKSGQSAVPAESAVVSSWLLLLYQLPLKPSRLRVKTWRRLQKMGAVQLKGSAYVLPNSAQAREDFEWIRAEVMAMKGEGVVFTGEIGDEKVQDEIIGQFQANRAADYQELLAQVQSAPRAVRQPENQRDQRRKNFTGSLRERWNEIAAIDFFGAPGREESREALERLEQASLQAAGQQPAQRRESRMSQSYRNRVWLTRPRPGVDRMSSAWLITRFIDPKAKFAFAEKPKERSRSVPFDMYGVEFSHHGDACTFETLVRHFAIGDPAVRRISKIVHDLDLKDDKFQSPEKAAVGAMVEGLRQMYRNDQELLREGMKMFEALYQSFTKKPVR